MRATASAMFNSPRATSRASVEGKVIRPSVHSLLRRWTSRTMPSQRGSSGTNPIVVDIRIGDPAGQPNVIRVDVGRQALSPLPLLEQLMRSRAA